MCTALAIGLGMTAAIADRLPAQTTPSPTSTAPAVSSATPDEGTPVPEADTIVWAREIDPATNEPIRKATAFVTTDPIIYAVMPIPRIEQGSVIEATWAYDGTPVPALTTTVTAEQSYENGWIEFHLTPPQGQIWPTGEYTISITIDGRQVSSSTIEVTVPPS